MSESRIQSIPTIVGLGEVLWDVFPDGPRFGGAPANFACSAAGLARDAGRVFMVSAVGRDALGHRALQEFRDHHVDASSCAQRDEPTGTVQVQIDSAGHATYEFAVDTAWDHLEWSDALEQLARKADAVCFGTLGQRSEPSRQIIRRFVESTRSDCLRILDVNLRPPFWTESVVRDSLPLANVIKCNDDELPIIADLLRISGSADELLGQLIERFSLKLAALTRGAGGSLLIDDSGNRSDLPIAETTVVDTVGAGDSFTAALTLGRLQGLSLAAAHLWAGQVAAFVCSQAGATPAIPDHLPLWGEAT